MCLNDSWHFGVIFWLASTPVYSRYYRDMKEHFQAERLTTRPTISKNNAKPGGARTFQCQLLNLCVKNTGFNAKAWRYYKRVLQPSVCPIFFICLRITQVHLGSLAWSCALFYCAAPTGPRPPERCTCLTLCDGDPAQWGARQRWAACPFLYPLSFPKVQAELYEGYLQPRREGEKRRVNVTQFGSCK